MPIEGKEMSNDKVWSGMQKGRVFLLIWAPAITCFWPDNALQLCHLFNDEKKL